MNYVRLWLFFFAVIGLAGCNPSSKQEEPAGEPELSGLRRDSAYAVRTVLTETRTFAYPIQARGKLRAARAVTLAFEPPGKLQALYVANSQVVAKGTLIARLQNERHQLAVAEARMAVANAGSEYENKLAEFGDSTTYGDNWFRIKEKLRLKTGVGVSQVNLDRALYELSQTYLYAPFDGIISGLELKPGNYLNSWQPLAVLLDRTRMEVMAEVLEFDLGGLMQGHKAQVSPLSLPGRVLEATVAEINPRVDDRGYVKVKLDVPYEPGLYDGMSVKVVLEIPQAEGLLVPKEAVVQKSGRIVVFTVEDSLAKWNYVTLGRDNGSYVEVTEGLKMGQWVIVSNNLQLAHDSPVRIENNTDGVLD
ncbi:MAG: efflux RND transporter periplasmic adaptor subunit [Cyclobacteriaceae bacterium]|nr:efflux RND transporter periplasmic adaptor subunit [Cyclobacteriaceae bacterium]